MTDQEIRELICELCRLFYRQGWVSGTGGGISIRDGDRAFIAPSGVQKERLSPEDLFVSDLKGNVLQEPAGNACISACTPLFLAAFELRDAGAVMHSHSANAVMATLRFQERVEIRHLEMIKGIEGHGYDDPLVIPIIENTAHEHDLADSLRDAIQAYPRTQAVLVRRHGIYVWGRDWTAAKRHAECYDYLLGVAGQMQDAGFDPSAPDPGREFAADNAQ